MTSIHISRVVAASRAAVYEYAREPSNLPRWAAGLATSPVTVEGDDLLVDSPMGRVRVHFAERNPFGVLDHLVTLADGSVVENPMRVLPHPSGCELVFTLRQLGMPQADFEADAQMVAEDLARLAALVEAQG